eukprot:CAMPEP_0202901620 /NCGR_PEP_ID=MMETSP1392-20130828/14361_1 /ASSEMBLY_ACC=CAM_ASM_000868 /TAXON_ID=225041 /ORGANISM="Chlamydomonas chlamydogama, Strain SAG 11-48b" /LENGTH=30 /DNA_ID= /DNA_START= /DNA_END= /DNA_ORIENTATION=
MDSVFKDECGAGGGLVQGGGMAEDEALGAP